MNVKLLPLPELSEADPPTGAEGSLDPLGLASIADRLADELLPGIRARMRRVRFITASAVGALATDDLHDVPSQDGVSTPWIGFEWLVLEAFARRQVDGALAVSGVPGSSKVRGVVEQGKRLTARNYLKAPNTFGFTGVYLPLARHFHVLDEFRRPSANITELTRAWEVDQGLEGFTDGTPGTPGAQLRSRIRGQVFESLRAGHCAEPEGSHLWKRLCTHLHPVQPGESERQLLTSWLTSDGEPVRAELASILVGEASDQPERDLVGRLRSRGLSADVAALIDAIVAYEDVCWLLDATFRQIRYLSTCSGTTAITPTVLQGDDTIVDSARRLPSAMSAAHAAIDRLDSEIDRLFADRLSRFQDRLSAAALGEAVLSHHESIQANKAPTGKRPWFDRYGGGWVVRSGYRHADRVDLDVPWFVHPYRLTPLQTFMKDLAS